MLRHSIVVRIVFCLSLSTLACAKGRGVRSNDASSSDVIADQAAGDRAVDTKVDAAQAEGGKSDGGSDVVVGPVGSGETGQPCAGGGECKTGFCVDSVCCAAACTGKCQACAEASTGSPNGVCGPAQAGLNPHDSCTASTPESCGDDGTCDGNGACRKYGSNQICVAGSCMGTTFNPARTCNGMGACGTAAAGTECGAYPCTVAGCAKPCAADAECGAQSYCAMGICNVKKTNGDACAVATECGSGFCADGVCCQTACTGACLSCSESDTGQKSGSCQPVAAGKDPADECPTDPAAMCGRDGTCDGKGACRKYDAATTCADATCTGTMFNPARTCANGVCTAGTAVDCKQAACSTAGCQTSCTKDADCASSAYCAGTSCAARKANGTACTTGNECSSKACVDGVCCETACTGLCYSCANAKTGQASGKCAPVTAGTDADNECAALANTTCGTEGSCDGAGACKKWAKGTQCAAGMCNTAGNFVSARTCDGVGTCSAATTDTCSPNVCAATGCVRTCTKDTDCVANNYCASGTCKAKKNGGAACGANNECVLGFCADGVCCNNACTGACMSCKAADNGMAADGTCANVSAGKDPANECAAGTTTCGLDGTCGGGKCRFAPTTTSCAGTVCTNGNNNSSATLTAAKSCDGNGACPGTGSSSACPGNVLCASASACKSSTCGTDADCINGYYCASGTCKAKGGAGSGCSSGNQCTTNNCSSDGVCCNSACTLACQGCNSSNTGVSSGTCAIRTSSGTTACNGQCVSGHALCGSTCISTTWNFEQGNVTIGGYPYGWHYDDPDREFPEIEISYVAGVGHTSSTKGTLAVHLPAGSGSGAVLILGVDTCSSGWNLGGKTITAWLARSTPSMVSSNCSFILGGPLSGNFIGSTSVGTAANSWTKMSGVIPATSSFSNTTNIDISCTTPLSDPAWDGTLYIDDVSISP